MLHRLIEQMHDANRQMIDYLTELAKTLEVPAELSRWASHILQAEEIWHSRMQQRPTPPHAFLPVPLERMAADNDANRDAYLDLVREIPTGEEAAQRVHYRTFDGTEGSSSPADIVLHVVTHGFHHRGQMATFCRQQELPPFPNTAYISYTRKLGL